MQNCDTTCIRAAFLACLVDKFLVIIKRNICKIVGLQRICPVILAYGRKILLRCL